MKRPFRWICTIALLTAALQAARAQSVSTETAPATPPSPHAAMPAVIPDGAVLPAGHPSIDDQTGARVVAQPAAVGSLSIQVVAGTAGGVVTPDDPVTLELYCRNALVKKIDVKLDADGKAYIGGLPVMPPMEALISIKHGGILQQVLSPELNPDKPNQSLQMKVFETTDERPEWNIAMQHMIVQWAEDGSGAHVTEMISANTPGDRAWLGAKVADQRVTLAIPLPPQADDVELGGSFDENLTRITDGKLMTGSTLFPGRSEFRITYTVPAKNGALELPIVAPEAVANLIVFLPADDVKVIATSLSGGNAVDMGEGSVRMYRAENLKGGQTALLSITGIKAAPPTNSADTATIKGSEISARNVAMGGAFLIALIGAGMILIKKPQSKKV